MNHLNSAELLFDASNRLSRASIALSKAQTFVPILGVVPAALTVVITLISFVISVAARFFCKPNNEQICNENILGSLLLFDYSILNIASLGMFAPIHEYVTEWISKRGHENKQSTAGFFDIFPTLRKGEQIKCF